MEIGNYVKPVEFSERILTIGKIKYTPVAVNPTKKELEDLKKVKGLNVFVPSEEPIYFGKQALDSTKPTEETEYFDVTIYLRSQAFPESIDRVTYRTYNTGRKSSTGKFEVINAYGATAWLTQEDVKNKKAPANMQWYVMDDVKFLRRGEAQLVAFIRSLRNLKNINQDTPDKQNYRSLFSDQDLKKMLAGDFKNIRNIILEVADANITFVTGVRFINDKKYQDIYKELPLRSYVADSSNSDDWIKTNITEAQSNNRYANTNFFLGSGLHGREYIDGMESSKSSSEDFDFETTNDLPMSFDDDDSDLPF